MNTEAALGCALDVLGDDTLAASTFAEVVDGTGLSPDKKSALLERARNAQKKLGPIADKLGNFVLKPGTIITNAWDGVFDRLAEGLLEGRLDGSGSTTSSEFACPDVQVPSASVNGLNTVFDATGDACGFPDQAHADLASLSWKNGPGSMSFTVSFAPPLTGSETSVITFSSTPEGLTDSCSATHLLLNSPPPFPPAALVKACEQNLNVVHTGRLTHGRDFLTTSIPNRYLPINAGGVYVRVSGGTILGPRTQTVVSDYLRDGGRLPLRIPVP